jgi:1-acyl-sn-glycerol-3-phosphate acyltransferase
MAGFLHKLSYVRSVVVTAPLVFAATAVMGSISLASSLFDSTGRIQDACARRWAVVVLWICRVKIRVAGTEKLSPQATYVFCANHQSHMDTPILIAAVPFHFRFTAKKELFRIPFLGWHLRRSGHVPVDRGNPHAALRAIRDARGKLCAGVSLAFFPEGGTSLDGSIKPFKAGGFLLATQAGAFIVPVTIRGSRDVLAPKTYHVRGGSVDVTFSRPAPCAKLSSAELASRTREEIVRTFENGKALDRHTHPISR